MARAPDARIEQAKAMYLKGTKLVEIANQLNLPEGTVRRWKCTHKWDSERSDKKANVRKKRGAPLGNRNAADHGAPQQNNNAEKFGFFRKYLPEETVSIIQEMPKDPLDILWDQIQIAYAAIIRAQKIMYVRDQEDTTTTQFQEKNGDTFTEERWEVQHAWDKQGNFLSAQARAQKTLEGMINRYEELLHKNWELATNEQKARISQIKAQTARLTGTESKEELEKLDRVLSEIKGVV
jgi:uncharacterized protein YjcR|uniref:Small Terminase n=1 Tax=Siphoviridae sp. ctGyV19 TaxID=2826225 RepID=A0A8S5MVI2_9CAUD|nr:MAG TPA: Small Terminase [Siphoviridae sp. ctGyV19]